MTALVNGRLGCRVLSALKKSWACSSLIYQCLCDSHPSNPHPAGEGLRWIAHGFSALGLTDHEILEREFIVYDALYAECKRQIGVTPKP